MNDATFGFVPAPAAETSALYRLVYRSEDVVTAGRGLDELQQLTATSAQMNALNGLSGALVYRSGQYLQILEGSRIDIESTFERICRDRRHRKLVMLEFAAVDQRRFGQWAMALARHDPSGGADVISLALNGIASEGGSEALLDAMSAAFDPL